MKYDDISKLLVAIAPPINVVNRIPMRSTSTPAIGDIRNVVPTVKDPTNAKTNIIFQLTNEPGSQLKYMYDHAVVLHVKTKCIIFYLL